MTQAQHLLVGNPTAQSGENAQRITRARQLLADHEIETDLLTTRPDGQTPAAVCKSLETKDYRCVISMGGDGTFKEVASGLLDCGRAEEITLAMLPTGTANDQGRSFGLSSNPQDLVDNVAVIADGHEARLDAGKIRGFDERGEPLIDTWFFDSAGWGLSARTLAARNLDRKWVEQTPLLSEVYRDHLLYAGALLRTFIETSLTPSEFTARVHIDGQLHELTALTDLLIKNTRIYAGAWVLDRTSRPDDGQFEVVPFRGKADWLSKGIVDLEGNPITSEELESLGLEHSKPLRGAELELEIDPPPEGELPPTQADGEELPAVWSATVKVLARALRLIVPRTAEANPG